MNAIIIGAHPTSIGRKIAETLAIEGHQVGLISRSAQTFADGPHFQADVLDFQSVATAFEKFAEAVPSIDCVVFAAGRLQAIGPIHEVDPGAWMLDLETTLKGFFHVARAAYPYLKLSKSATLIGLVGPGHAGELAFGTGYGAAQAGLIRLVESLEVEWRRDDIAVYAVNPGTVPTGFMKPLLDTDEGRKWLPRFTEALAEGKEVGPEVSAEMVKYLAEKRPKGLSGRVVASLLVPELLELRIDRIVAEDLGRLRLR
jgi:NAD(P)-dependent dehydrogenase (short-subunit alcohol dehydrogenase family)